MLEYPNVWPDKFRIWSDPQFRFHRDGGPALEYPDGSKAWYRNGRLLRMTSGEGIWTRADIELSDEDSAFLPAVYKR